MKKLLIPATILALAFTSTAFAHEGHEHKHGEKHEHKHEHKHKHKMTIIETALTVEAATEKLTNVLKEKGMTIFATVDHQKAAQGAGLQMQPAKVIIYGTPKAGTPLMIKDPHLALRLPLKVLITQNKKGKTEVVFDTADKVIKGTTLTYQDVENNLAKAEKLIEATIK